jgi:Putative bacterial virulence factor
MNHNVQLRRQLNHLATAATSFADQIDQWIRRFGAQYGESGSGRIPLLGQRSALRRLQGASFVGKSVGFYGESQCGKSNLVSRIGEALGVAVTPDGSLLVMDPLPDAAVGAPWRHGRGGTSAGIEFAKWLNPSGGKEATGVVCRLVRRAGPVEANIKPGCFVASILSHEDLLASLSLGSLEELKQADPKSSEDAARGSLERVRTSSTEQDREGFIPALLSAWRFLNLHSGDHPRIRALVDIGFPATLERYFLEGRRPIWNPREHRGSAFLELAGLLWGGEAAIGEVYEQVLVELNRLGGTSQVAISALDVCKGNPDDPHARKSLLDVSILDGLFERGASADSVQIHYRDRGGSGEVRTVGMPRAALVALIRELELPLVGVGEPLGGGDFDVEIIDYPGAIAGDTASDLSQGENPHQIALQAFRRGKLNKLFLTAVDLHDCSALCLAVSGQGNLTAGKTVRDSLKAWLLREGWNGSSATPAEFFEHEAPLRAAEPALVVAVTKSDQLLADDGESLFGSRIQVIQSNYCRNLDWLDRWNEAGCFRRIHWVHNPDKGVVKTPSKENLPPSMLQTRAREMVERIRDAYSRDVRVSNYVEHSDAKLSALLSDPPGDVQMLFRALRTAAEGVDREGRLAREIADLVGVLESATGRFYVGPNDRERVAKERQAALDDVGALRAALKAGFNPVAELLRALRVTPVLVERVLRSASADAASTDHAEVGVISFEDFYSALRQRFSEQLDRELRHGQARWIDALRRNSGDEDRLGSIVERFSRIPGSLWFRGEIEGRVGPMIGQQDAGALHGPVVGAIASRFWNRGIVWLDQVPEASAESLRLPPKLRAVHAASERILNHWEARLPEVYVKLVDENNARRPGNSDLGLLRQRMHDAVDAFARCLGDCAYNPDRASLVRRLESLRDRLESGIPSSFETA